MNLHISVKFRAFGITFGTVDQKFPLAPIFTAIVQQLQALLAKEIPAVGAVDASGLASQISIPSHVFYNDRGVLVEVIR